ncbi:hypothetical protein [Marinospirillum minutulum]|uniref:hypothetical protein n=1 Tax=Marinospirillum minutulum TaxID=64974 RepID=UPI00040DB7AC|nr:hypothetical protein [Marinospirillum minutulum]
MIWHLIAAIFCGLAAAGIALFIRKLSRNKLPKWIIPLAVGIGMLSYQIYTEYNWYSLKILQLPAASEVVITQNKSNIWRPWTYVIPMVGAFTLVDRESVKVGQVNDEKLAEFMLYRFERQHVDRVKNQQHLLNCTTKELVPLQADGVPLVEELKKLEETDLLFIKVCIETN